MISDKAVFYEPSLSLKPFIRFYVDASLDKSELQNYQKVNFPTIYPALNLFYSDSVLNYRIGEKEYLDHRFFFGGITGLTAEVLNPQSVKLISVFFYPGGFPHVFNLPLKAYAHSFSLLRNLDRNGYRLFKESFLGLKDTKSRIHIIDNYLLKKLKASTWQTNVVDSVIEMIMESSGKVKVQQMSEKLDVPVRTLSRKFSDVMGVSIKEFINIYRIHTISVMLTSEPGINVQELIYKMGYYDQSHLVKHLKTYLGFTLGQFFALGETFLRRYSDIENSDPYK